MTSSGAPARPSRLAVVTPVAGRHDHLRAQQRHLAGLSPDLRVVVSMGDQEIEAIVTDDPLPRQVIISVPLTADGDLPLARARNAGISAAVAAGADLVVVLDVDCLPGQELLTRYASAAEQLAGEAALLCGPVTYLPAEAGAPAPETLASWTKPHAARPDVSPGELQRGGDHRLFWSLSFAVAPATWSRLGGFHEGFTGYGAEDTDLGFTARAQGIDLVWVGGAHAYHQHHPVSDPPVEHLDSILRNAAVFHRRWGVWPMEGWLDAFSRMGLARFDGTHWVATGTDATDGPSGASPSRTPPTAG